MRSVIATRAGTGLAFGLAALILAAAPAAATPLRVPAGFVGVVPQAPLRAADLERIGRLGLDVRLPVFWYDVERRPGEYDFEALDRVIGAAADRGIRVLPQLGGSPGWATPDPARPPLGRSAIAAWRGFLRAMVERYGPDGDFWQGRGRRVPVRRWQVWNEPNFWVFWRPRPTPRGYARLLHASAAAIRGADPGARIVAAAVAPIERALKPWEFMRRMYRVPGFRDDFDVAALHPYSPSLRGVEYQVRRFRRVMARAGDGRKPLLLTELGVASDGVPPTAFDRGPLGQARFLERTFERLLERRRRWRIAGAYWFTWRDAGGLDPSCSFCQHAGLLDVRGEPKPAWWALRRVVSRGTARAVR